MKDHEKCLKKKISIHASTLEIYGALTNAAALSDWFCNIAHATPVAGGGIYLWWPDQTYVVGEFIELKPGKTIRFTWHGIGEPARSQVEIQLKKKKDVVRVNLTHCGVGKGKQWRPYRQRIKLIWKQGLENLQSVLESGHDLRLVAALTEQGWTIPEIPSTIEEITEAISQATSRIDDTLAALALEYSDDVVELYSQIVVHERRLHAWIDELINGQDPLFFDALESDVHAQATAGSFSTLTLLQEELRHNQTETLMLLKNIRGEIYENKRKYWLLGTKMLFHIAALEDKIHRFGKSISDAAKAVSEKEE